MISRFVVSESPVVGARRNRRSIWAALAACLFGAATAFIGMDGFTTVHTKARPGDRGADANHHPAGGAATPGATIAWLLAGRPCDKR